jgi:hypothetical protein
MTMTMTTGLRGRRALVVATAVAAAVVGLAVPAMAAQAPAAQTSQPRPQVLGAGQTGTRAAVPWSKVGPAWALAMFSRSTGGEGVKPTNGSTTLYLVDPAGGKYSLFTWPARSPETGWDLLAWSGDTQRAMFLGGFGDSSYVYQLQLRTGKTTSFKLPANVFPIGYTRPDGLNILTDKSKTDGQGILQRYSLAGKLQRTIATVYNGEQVAAYQPAGATLAVGVKNGLELVGNNGGVSRKLPVAGVKYGCSPVRWWSSSTILASCSVANEPGGRLWLVPASGARPSALTPVRRNGFDLGDFDAWQLSSGLYLDGLGACGTLVIGKQPAHGPEQQVNVPGANSSLIVTATRSSLMVERINGCSPGVSLVWFNPTTRKMTVAIATHGNQHGVMGVAPYFVTGKF